MKIGSLNNIPWYARLGIFVAIAVAVYAGFWYFVTKGKRQETKELTERIEVLKKQNVEAQIASQRLSEFRTQYKNKQQELDELRALLPEQRELTNVLQGIQDRARASSLQVRKFTPKDDVQQDFYSGKKIEVAVQSSFSGLRQFFDQMAKYQRIVPITNSKSSRWTSRDEQDVEARFDLTAYYVSSEKLQKAPPPPPPGTQPAPPAPENNPS